MKLNFSRSKRNVLSCNQIIIAGPENYFAFAICACVLQVRGRQRAMLICLLNQLVDYLSYAQVCANALFNLIHNRIRINNSGSCYLTYRVCALRARAEEVETAINKSEINEFSFILLSRLDINLDY